MFGLFGFDPLGALGDAMEKFVTGLMAIFSLMLGQPQALSPDSTSDAIFAAFVMLAAFMAVPVSSLVVVLAMLFKHRLASVAHAIIVFFTLSVIGTGWVGFGVFLMTFGDQLAKAAGWYQRGKDITIPAFQDVIGAIFGSLTIAGWGGALMLVIAFFGLANYVVLALTPLAFSLSPLGRRAQAFFEWLFSIGVVSMVFGRATARLIVDFGRYFMDVRKDDNWFVQCVYIAVTFGTAIYVEIALIKSIHRKLQSFMGRVTGRSTAKVSGKVDTNPKRRQEVDVKSINAIHQGALSPVMLQQNTAQTNAVKRTSVRTMVANQASQRVHHAVLAKAAASAHPVGRAVVTVHEVREAKRQISRQRELAQRSMASIPQREGEM